MNPSLLDRTRSTLDQLRDELLAERNDGHHWTGTLSPSALSTATAVSAMSSILIHSVGSQQSGVTADEQITHCIAAGVQYLQSQQNEDGGFGDTDRSHSNIATSYLVQAASALADQAIGRSLTPETIAALEKYIAHMGKLDALKERYGTDKTFVVPILTNMAIAGLVPWEMVSALPFEAAVFPQSMYRMLQMPVVSYAIPALVAIGQARHFHGPKAFFPIRLIRGAAIGRSISVLEKMQPQSGGYLEATPLTSFVVMSLAVTKRADHKVSRRGLDFLKDSMNEDGSWPIDTNLATWVTSLSMNALAADPTDDRVWCTPELADWHLRCQHEVRHPFTGAEPGGWGWSDLSGAVPDSDDTPAAILALGHMKSSLDEDRKQRCEKAMKAGRGWLLKLQNRDGGWPTFCRGWGKLPFDRSSNDLTAHALRALAVNGVSEAEAGTARHIASGTRFLEKNQEPDGSWLPLWFGNQDHADESNPVYGTSRVLLAATSGALASEALQAGCQYLVNNQNSDGGWGGGGSVASWLKKNQFGEFEFVSSVEETALAVEALATVVLCGENSILELAGEDTNRDKMSETDRFNPQSAVQHGGTKAMSQAIIRGVEFLLESVDQERHRVPWPIGFYFAKLWYHERLYPLIFTTGALGKYLQLAADKPTRKGSTNETNSFQNPTQTLPEV
ncbi:MAG: squalene--hopene cyclase [Rhodopirellula sp.]|nr:squalene--hopene cyclase [Rhodopirellula sp.]